MEFHRGLYRIHVTGLHQLRLNSDGLQVPLRIADVETCGHRAPAPQGGQRPKCVFARVKTFIPSTESVIWHRFP